MSQTTALLINKGIKVRDAQVEVLRKGSQKWEDTEKKKTKGTTKREGNDEEGRVRTKGRTQGRPRWEEKVYYPCGRCCAQSNQYKPLLSTSSLSPVLFYKTWPFIRHINPTDQHCRHIILTHTCTQTQRRGKQSAHRSKINPTVERTRPINSLDLMHVAAFFFWFRKDLAMIARFSSVLRSNNVASSIIQNQVPMGAKCSKCHCYWTDLSRSNHIQYAECNECFL